MNSRDIDIFLKAKKQQKYTKKINIATILVLLLYIIFLLFGIHHHYSDVIVASILIAVTFQNSDINFSGSADKVRVITRNDLLNVIENSINNDADALEYIRSK